MRPCFSSLIPYHMACKVMLTFHHLIIMVLVLLTCDRQPLLDLWDAIYVIDITCLSLYFTTHLLPISPSILFWRKIHSHRFPIIHISAIKLYGPSNLFRDLSTSYPSRKFLSRSRSKRLIDQPIESLSKRAWGVIRFCIVPFPYPSCTIPLQKTVRFDDHTLVKSSPFKAQGPSSALQPPFVLFFVQVEAVKGFSSVVLFYRGILTI